MDLGSPGEEKEDGYTGADDVDECEEEEVDDERVDDVIPTYLTADRLHHRVIHAVVSSCFVQVELVDVWYQWGNS